MKKQRIQKMSIVEMRRLRWISGSILKDRIKNGDIYIKLEVASIKHKMREAHLRWFIMYKKAHRYNSKRKMIDL